MAKYIITCNAELRVESETFEDAMEKADQWRSFVSESLRGKVDGLGIEKVSMKTIKEIIEVDEAWIQNHSLRSKFQAEWDYEIRQIPLFPGSKLFFTLRVAKGPTAKHQGVIETIPKIDIETK